MITPPSMNNHDPHNYAHGSPHSPHTAPDPMVLAQPEYSQQHSISSPSSAYQNINYSSSTTNSPHTAALQYDSPNPNPQLGHVHLDFIPLPTNQPSAPPQLLTSIPAEARYQTVPLPYVAPPPPPPPPSVPYPVPPSTDTQQPHYENVTFVDATPIDMSKEKYKLSPAAGGSTVLEDLRNPRKKIFWIFNIIVLAIIFGVLGATVWKPDSNENGEGRSHTPTPKPSVIPRTSPVVATPVTAPVVPSPVTARVGTTSATAPVVPTPVVVPTHVTAPPPPPPPRPSSPPKPTGGGGDGGGGGGGGGGGVDMSCEWACRDVANKCENNCRATDSSYKSCTAKCTGRDFCDLDCESSNGCLGGCLNTWGNCALACG